MRRNKNKKIISLFVLCRLFSSSVLAHEPDIRNNLARFRNGQRILKYNPYYKKYENSKKAYNRGTLGHLGLKSAAVTTGVLTARALPFVPSLGFSKEVKIVEGKPVPSDLTRSIPSEAKTATFDEIMKDFHQVTSDLHRRYLFRLKNESDFAVYFKAYASQNGGFLGSGFSAHPFMPDGIFGGHVWARTYSSVRKTGKDSLPSPSEILVDIGPTLRRWVLNDIKSMYEGYVEDTKVGEISNFLNFLLNLFNDQSVPLSSYPNFAAAFQRASKTFLCLLQMVCVPNVSLVENIGLGYRIPVVGLLTSSVGEEIIVDRSQTSLALSELLNDKCSQILITTSDRVKYDMDSTFSKDRSKRGTLEVVISGDDFSIKPLGVAIGKLYGQFDKRFNDVVDFVRGKKDIFGYTINNLVSKENINSFFKNTKKYISDIDDLLKKLNKEVNSLSEAFDSEEFQSKELPSTLQFLSGSYDYIMNLPKKFDELPIFEGMSDEYKNFILWLLDKQPSTKNIMAKYENLVGKLQNKIQEVKQSDKYQQSQKSHEDFKQRVKQTIDSMGS